MRWGDTGPGSRKDAAPRLLKGFATGHTDTTGARLRLLLIHADAELASFIRGQLDLLAFPACSLAHFTHLKDGMVYLGVAPVDVVMIGTAMADADLPTGVRRISSRYPELPMVALAAGLDPVAQQEFQNMGARVCLNPRSMNSEAWLRMIHSCLREQKLTNQLAEATARLDWLTHRDVITGVLNRRGLERAIMRELARCRELGVSLNVMMIDLDDFRHVNATLGHRVGDMVLASAARRISETVGNDAMVGRCGMDQFLAMLPGMGLPEMESLAEEVRLAVSRDSITAGQEVITTTASLGVIVLSAETMSCDEVLARARFSLGCSKLAGKNRVTAGDGGHASATVRTSDPVIDMVQELLGGTVLDVASQPIVGLTDGRIVSQEMLIRGPRGPLFAPDNLFRFCQEQDILTAVDLRCLKLCAATAARQGPHARYHVNILPTTLLQTPVEELIRVLDFGAGAGDCCLEISEQQLLGDPTVLVDPVHRLQAAGIGIAIDDVGFGNSCLEGLLVLKPEVLKIDKRLVRGLADDKALRSILQRLLRISAVLGAEVVAEGIENQADLHVLLDLGVRLGQGYLFGRPELCRHNPHFNVLVDVSTPQDLSAEA